MSEFRKAEENFKELINWAELYWERKTMSSFDGHKKIFNQFSGTKLEFTSRNQVDDWLSIEIRLVYFNYEKSFVILLINFRIRLQEA